MSNKDDKSKYDKKINRNSFFKSLLSLLGRPVSNYIEKKTESLRGKLLRPPGAGFELEFLSLCSRCHLCAKNCPEYAIRIFNVYIGGSDQYLDKTPYIDPEKQPCIMCKDAPCIQSCPTGALHPLKKIEDMKIGVAEVNSNCLLIRGSICDECVNICPLGEDVITSAKNNIYINIKKCTGCGLCVYRCPTEPKAITIEKIIY